MNLLIIGGSGHVSGAVARAALAKGYTVWTVTRGQRPLPRGVRALTADRHEPDAMETVVSGEGLRWNLVVDCICYDLPDIRQDIRLFRDRADRFVLVSTDFVYDPAQREFPQPVTGARYVTGRDGSMDYGRKKRLCEEELINTDTGGMAWTVVRPCHIYGPTSELGCLPLHGRDPELIGKLRRGEALRLVGGGHFLQQPILADDLAETILSVAHAPSAGGGIFNTAGPDVIESWQYYRIVAEALGADLSVEEVPIRSFLADNPGKTPFMCHRIYDLAPLAASGLSVPSTPVAEGLRLHVEGLLARRGQDPAPA